MSLALMNMRTKTIIIGFTSILAAVGLGVIGAKSFIGNNQSKNNEKSARVERINKKLQDSFSKLEKSQDLSNSSSLVSLEDPKGEDLVETQKSEKINNYKARVEEQAKDTAKQSRKAEFMNYATEMLDRMVNGSNYAIAGYWCPSSSSFESYLFSPRSYQILGEPSVTDKHGFLNVRVESSNKGGREITNTWRFSFKNEPDKVGQNWCLWLVGK